MSSESQDWNLDMSRAEFWNRVREGHKAGEPHPLSHPFPPPPDAPSESELIALDHPDESPTEPVPENIGDVEEDEREYRRMV